MRAYDFYSRVEFSDTYQRVNTNRTKHFPCCNLFISEVLRFFRVVFRRHVSQINGAMKWVKDIQNRTATTKFK